MENESTDEIQIDIFRAIKSVLRQWPLIIIATIVTGIFAYSYTSKNIVSYYSSSGKIYIIDKEQQEITLSIEDLDIGSRLVEDYKELIKSRIVLEKVIRDLKLNLTYEELLGCITITNPTDTRIIEISLQYGDGEQIKNILNRIEDTTCKNLSKKMGTENPTILERACEPRKYTENSAVKKTLIYAMGVAFMISAFLAFLDIMNWKIRYEEEVAYHLQLNVIGNIPQAKKSGMRII